MTKHVTVQLQPARGESISQELAILALVGAVNLVPGTYTVDNAPLVAAAALDAAPADGPAVPEVVEPPLSEQLVEQWVAEVWHEGTPVRVAASDLYLAAKAAEWGARWGRPAPAPAGEVGEVARWLRSTGEGQPLLSDEGYARLTRAADLLERQAAPVPVASNVYFEFVVSDADYCPQAEGIAPSYAQALSKGQHYLAQYQQDGPHTLEVRRVENLNPGAFPVPDDAPLSLLPEDAQALLAQTEPPPPVAGEVAELVAWLRNMAEAGLGGLDELNAGCAADLLERQYPQPVQLKKDDDIIRVHEMASILASIGEIESLEGLAYALLHHPRFTINPR